jgi:hypothetical protein
MAGSRDPLVVLGRMEDQSLELLGARDVLGHQELLHALVDQGLIDRLLPDWPASISLNS